MSTDQSHFRSRLSIDSARRLLGSMVPSGEGWGRHSVAVADVARHLCIGIEAAGASVDQEFAVSAALLHDVGRSRTHHPALHGWEGYLVLANRGLPRHGVTCITHVLKGRPLAVAVEQGILPVEALEEDFASPLSPLDLENAIVAVADAMVVDTVVVDIAARYRRSRSRYPGDAFIAENEALSYQIRTALESVLGHSLYDALPPGIWNREATDDGQA